MADADVRTLARLARMLERSAGGLTRPQFRVLALVEEDGEPRPPDPARSCAG